MAKSKGSFEQLGSEGLNIVGDFCINNHCYQIINLDKNISKLKNLTQKKIELTRFKIKEQILAIIEVEKLVNDDSDIIPVLTNREIQVANFVAIGYCNKEIAKRLNISTCTVSSYLRRIFTKLKVDSRAAMVYKLVLSQKIQPKTKHPEKN